MVDYNYVADAECFLYRGNGNNLRLYAKGDLSDSKALETEVVCLVEQRRLVEYFEYGVY
jgi:hypothetical protein